VRNKPALVLASTCTDREFSRIKKAQWYLGCCGTVLNEEPGQIHMTTCGRPTQQGRPVLCRVGAVLDEESGQIDTTLFGCSIQRRQPVLVLGRHIGAVLDEESGQIHMTH